MRLFTAAVPPPDVADHLAAALAGIGKVDWVPRDSWHITLGYYGEDDPGTRVPWVREQVKGLVAPTVSLTDAGNFGHTVWMGVSAVDSSFQDLGTALRWNDRHDWHPHLTVGHGEPIELPYSGPQWTVDEVLLLGAGRRYVYTVLDRLRFAA
ncbi:2'-5' RNA ligase family protein [Kibdelosporangium persicum]|uniref:2'-5' RNA ligase n=1 Tax=Kibdelosporangium persicum TaxID=2698649 RepID=A0ABX2EY41_9PSEU|nr:2'-5' RNA ligase family protein [Kibdelosporangium persicum]NRN63632.1 2'-5' RNA ligase [Kibdelosporangium persicum]